MRVLILTNEDGLAGSTFSVSYLCAGLAARGHQVWLACRPDSLLWRLLRDSSVQLVSMTFRGKFDAGSVRQIASIVREHGIELINAQSSRDRYLSIWARSLCGLDVSLVHTRRQMPLSNAGWLQSLLYHRGTDRIVAVSHGVKLALAGSGIPDYHIAVIHNGTPLSEYESIQPSTVNRLRARFGISAGETVIGCVSRRKKQEQLLDALRYVPDPVSVILVGTSADKRLSRLAREVQELHTVHFAGRLDAADALACQKLFTMSVLPSTMEGLSQSMLESMTLGVPVIATNSGGNSEVVSHEVTGLLFEDGDVVALARHIRALAADPSLRHSLARAAYSRVREQFSIDRTIAAHERLYSTIIAERTAQYGVVHDGILQAAYSTNQ